MQLFLEELAVEIRIFLLSSSSCYKESTTMLQIPIGLFNISDSKFREKFRADNPKLGKILPKKNLVIPEILMCSLSRNSFCPMRYFFSSFQNIGLGIETYIWTSHVNDMSVNSMKSSKTGKHLILAVGNKGR